MANYRVVGTITWQMESEQSLDDCLQLVKQKFGDIVSEPYGLEDFSVQVEIAKMKDKRRLVHLAEFTPEDVFQHITTEEMKKEYKVGNKTYYVRMNSDRYFVFSNNRFCTSCGIEGTKMILDKHPNDASPHFNLYAEEKGRLILMTKDHIIAKSKNGEDALSNYATCCSICNNLKGNYDLTYEQVRLLRELSANGNKMTHKELRDLINKKRDEMAKKEPHATKS